jgi:hypothetical protein
VGRWMDGWMDDGSDKSGSKSRCGAGGGSMRDRYYPVKVSLTAVSAGGLHSSLFYAK